MIVTINDVNFDGVGNAWEAEYQQYDVDNFKFQQPSSKDAAQVNVIKKGTIEPVSAIIGLDASGNQLHDPNHLLILPCPPYCGKSGFEVSFAAAREYIQTP